MLLHGGAVFVVFGGRGLCRPLFSLGGRKMFFVVFGGRGLCRPSSVCVNSGRIFRSPPFFLLWATDERFVSPSVRRLGDIWCFVPLPFSGKGEAFSGDEEKELEFWAKQETCFKRKRTRKNQGDSFRRAPARAAARHLPQRGRHGGACPPLRSDALGSKKIAAAF